MDDRNTDLTHLFVRDLDEIPLPPRGEWRRAAGRGSAAMRASRMLLAAAAIVAVVAIALIAGNQLNERQQNAAAPSTSPRPSAGSTGLPIDVRPSPTANPNVTPTPAATVTGAYNDSFGFLLTEPGAGQTAAIRTESGTRLGSFDQMYFAVSPDGQQIAWFTPAGPQPQQLRIASAADISKSQLLRTLGADERGGTIVWSNDASGLLYQTYSPPAPSPPSPPADPSLYAIHEFDMRGTITPDRVVLTSPIRGLVLHPVAWDRGANVAAVVETGEGGFMGSYDVIRSGSNGEPVATKTTGPNGQILAFSMAATSDAKLVLAATFENGGSVSWWPIADFGARKTITGAGTGFWRPQTHEVATVGGCAGDPACGPNGGVRLLDVEKGTSRIVYGASRANLSLRTFRADGSALVLAAPQAPGATLTDYTLVPLSGAPPVTFTEVNGLLASVRLR